MCPECKRLAAEAATAAAEQRMGEGRSTGNPPYGYMVGHDDGTLIENPREQQIMSDAVEYRSWGMVWVGVADELNRDGKRTRKGGLWTAQGICQNLRRWQGE